MLTLNEKLASDSAASERLTLPYELRQRSRQRVRLDSGREAGIMLASGTTLSDGDHLRAIDGTVVRVCAALEAVSTARSDDPLRLARAAYHLGNRHVRLQVGDGWVRYQPDHVLDEMVRGLGLSVLVETACFEPEHGAYGVFGHRHHGHGHAHDHDHDQEHAHQHGQEHGHHTVHEKAS